MAGGDGASGLRDRCETVTYRGTADVLLRAVGQLMYFDVLWDRGVAGGDGSAGPGGPEGQPAARHLALRADLRRLPTPLLRHHRHQQRRQRPAGYVTHTLSHTQGTSLTHSATCRVRHAHTQPHTGYVTHTFSDMQGTSRTHSATYRVRHSHIQ